MYSSCDNIPISLTYITHTGQSCGGFMTSGGLSTGVTGNKLVPFPV